MKALIDSDIQVYAIGFTTEDEEEWIAKSRLGEAMNTIINAVEANDFTCYLTSQDKSNFRLDIDPLYKAHRVLPKPRHYLYLRNLLIKEYGAEVAEGQEADDLLGINQTKDTCICTTDKDLDQIPGDHYNWVTLRRYTISPVEAYRSFYMQVLQGDATDGVEGVPGIGKVKSLKLLEGAEDANEMLDIVSNQYLRAFGKQWLDKLYVAGNLLWVRKKPNQSWELSSGEVVSKELLNESYGPDESPTSTNQDDTSTSFLSIEEPTSQTSS